MKPALLEKEARRNTWLANKFLPPPENIPAHFNDAAIESLHDMYLDNHGFYRVQIDRLSRETTDELLGMGMFCFSHDVWEAALGYGSSCLTNSLKGLLGDYIDDGYDKWTDYLKSIEEEYKSGLEGEEPEDYYDNPEDSPAPVHLYLSNKDMHNVATIIASEDGVDYQAEDFPSMISFAIFVGLKLLSQALIPGLNGFKADTLDHSDLRSPDTYFRSERDKALFALLAADQSDKYTLLGITHRHFLSKSLAEQWKEDILGIVPRDNKQAIATIEQIYKQLTNQSDPLRTVMHRHDSWRWKKEDVKIRSKSE